MARRGAIMQHALGLDYARFEREGGIDFGYEGVVAATSGNYGAAVASQAAMRGIKAIILQEAFDSQWRGQPEILEKTRACESYGAEVWQMTVGPELFYWHLITLEETRF